MFYLTVFIPCTLNSWYFVIVRYSQRGQDECCVWGQWLSLSCQWELTLWVSVCVLLWSVTLSISWLSIIFSLKSSDLSINPHISLNLWNPWNPQWNPQIYADFLTVKSTDFMAILRFSLNPWADLKVFIFFVWMSVWQLV